MAIIEVKNLTIEYNQVEVVKNISFDIQKGDYIGLAGPNGAGKTTLIKAILGLIPNKKGSISLFDKNINQFKDWNKIGYLPQKFATVNTIFPATVKEVVALGLLAQKKWPRRISKSDYTKANEILSELGIENLSNKMVSQLSGGQQQKVYLARALVSNPEILIFDEPSTALDPKSRESFFVMIEKLNKENNIAIILITHDTGYIGKYANKLLYIDRELVYFGKFSEFCRDEKMDPYFGKYEHHLICHQHE